MKNRVCMLQFARLHSSRVPDKLLQTVDGRRLIDVGLSWMRVVADRAGCQPVLAVNPEDKPLIEAAGQFGIEVFPLDERAKNAEAWPVLIAPLVDFLQERCDVVWDANICCRPFLRYSTGETIAKYCQETGRPFVCVTTKRGIVWSDHSDTPVIGAGLLANTRRNPYYSELGHICYCWPTWALSFTERQLAEQAVPVQIRLMPEEMIDIDTPTDLEFARIVAVGMRNRVIDNICGE